MQQPRREVVQSPRGRARKERLLEAATRLFARNGSRGTSLAQIADEAGVSQAGLVYHFPTKEALLHAVLDRRDEAERYFRWPEGQEPGLNVVRVIAQAVKDWTSHPEMVGMHSVLVAENVGQDGQLRPRLISRYHLSVDWLSAALRAGQKSGEIRLDVDTDQKAIEMIAFINGLETAWLLDPSIPAARTAAQWAADQVLALQPSP